MTQITKKYSKTSIYNIKEVWSSPAFLSTFKNLLKIRNKTGQKTQQNCFVCGKKFVDNDLLGLLVVENKLNQLAHRKCCEELEQ